MISIIVAVATNNVIGCHNRLIWHISDDLKRFKALTTGHSVVMGRKTFESIGRPLPNRRNIVVSRQAGLAIEGVEVVASIEAAFALTRGEDEVFVIGGGEVYGQALPMASKIYLTRVDQCPDGDTMFPRIDPLEWQTINSQEFEGFTFIDLERKNNI